MSASARSYPRVPHPTFDVDVIRNIQLGIQEEIGFIIPEELSDSDLEPCHPQATLLDAINLREELRCVEGLLSRLTPRQANAVRLSLADKSVQDIATALNVTWHSAQALLARATKNLQRLTPTRRYH